MGAGAVTGAQEGREDVDKLLRCRGGPLACHVPFRKTHPSTCGDARKDLGTLHGNVRGVSSLPVETQSGRRARPSETRLRALCT